MKAFIRIAKNLKQGHNLLARRGCYVQNLNEIVTSGRSFKGAPDWASPVTAKKSNMLRLNMARIISVIPFLLFGLAGPAMAADVDYEFSAALLSNKQSQVDRLKAPGTNYQVYYPTNGRTEPALGPIKDAKVVIRYDDKQMAYVYELAIPWAHIGDLGKRVAALSPGGTLSTHFAFTVNDSNGPGRTYWTQEAGDLEAGSYGFSPTWGGGSRKMGGRIVTDWGFSR